MEPSLKAEKLETGVMLVTLNRPETLNALDAEMGTMLIDAINDASQDDAVKAMVLTGAGRGFCAGANATRIGAAQDEIPPRSLRTDRLSSSGHFIEAMANCDVPVIAAVNGAAAGGGFGIAMCCDIRFMAASARMGTIFIKRGLSSDYGLSLWLPRIIGLARAFELCYDGNTIDSARALEIGLVNRVYPDEALLAETLAYAAKIAKGPPLGYTSLRKLLMRSSAPDRADFAEYEWGEQARLLQTKDCLEGFRSFLEKREPTFKGI